MSKTFFKIFLADDDEDDRMLFSEALEEISLQTSLSLFCHGQELLDYLFQPDVQLPNFIFLDLNMPIKNGLQCLTEIRNNPHLKGLNVAIYSTSSSQRDIEESYSKGANLYINKPNNFTTLRDVIENVLTRNEELHLQSTAKENFLFRI
ncbi:response regulator [Flavobacterium sp. UMI-01]|uniref:response regulator n=1 Tax=Flavobacterium sp. UMI-01 TaxID=1441053 RepID=UPI001C7D82E8|nr:response regulator [Flavobacterium sp. UMI-01]GIZ08185.1 response regulator [Flavobacterium sp. UMI-01]